MPATRREVVALPAALLAALILAACAGEPTSEPSAAGACSSQVVTGEVPPWARAGFTPGAIVPHVVGDEGRIVAVLFSYPLVANTDAEHPRNKVLLVAKEVPQTLSPVTIEARLHGTDTIVDQVRESGPGPGSLDLPAPGCWSLTLRWGDQADTLDLEYVN